MAKPGRAQDRKQTNRREKHELAWRSAQWKAPRLAVILADYLADKVPHGDVDGLWTARQWIMWAKSQLRRANRAARKAGKP